MTNKAEVDLTKLGAFFSLALKNALIIPFLKPEPDKPIDTGNGFLTASIGKRGAILSLSTYHPTEGYVVIHSEPQFPAAKYWDVRFVKEYRARLADLDSAVGFGFFPVRAFDARGQEYTLTCHYEWISGVVPVITLQGGPITLKILTFPGLPGESRIYQALILSNQRETMAGLTLRRGGVISVNRAAYGQLTEGGPLPPPPVSNLLSITVREIKVLNPNLGLGVSWRVYGGEEMFTPNRPAQIEGGGELPVTVWHEGNLQLPPFSTRLILNVFTVIRGSDQLRNVSAPELKQEAPKEGAAMTINGEEIRQAWEQSLHKPSVYSTPNLTPASETFAINYLITRNIDYILSCCAVPVGSKEEEGICLLTDHQILPLSWNRDAYFQIALLRNFSLQRKKGLENKTYAAIHRVIRSHLFWVFNLAERINGFWGRSYTANGRVKDKAFQLDQQCYPLLELVEYVNSFNGEELFSCLKEKVTLLTENLLSLKTEGTWLLKTAETPADDRADLPYHFSSQVLWWYLCRNLHMLNERYYFSPRNFGQIAAAIQEEIKQKMVVKDRGLFCYMTDLKSSFRLYHDANDLPTVYAPEWGFCSTGDPLWLKTMEFAFSPANEEGYFPGPYGGLGSVHTPQPWPLGAVQALIFARLTKNRSLYKETLQGLIRLAQADGLFPEAVSATEGKVVSRHWFSWPGALLATELLKGTGDLKIG